MDAPACRSRALAVPCRDSCPGGWWTPRVAANNSGVGGLTADSCAGCHRAHTAQGALLLIEPTRTALCLTCHGATGTGATTDVESGVQYAPTGDRRTVRGSAVLGALRGGGFVQARIASGARGPRRVPVGTSVRQLAKVPVARGRRRPSRPRTSPSRTARSSTATRHGLGQRARQRDRVRGPDGRPRLRHLPQPARERPVPDPQPGPGPDRDVGHGRFVRGRPGRARHRRGRSRRPATRATTPSSRPTAAPARSSRARSPRSACRPRRATTSAGSVPWNGTTGTSNDAPNGLSATFNTQITPGASRATRATSAPGGRRRDAGRDLQVPAHRTNATSRNCITCHVAHGSNAQMTRVDYSQRRSRLSGRRRPLPAGDSRLLKVDNRGTCQLCHDPTGTITAGTQVGPTPVPCAPLS